MHQTNIFVTLVMRHFWGQEWTINFMTMQCITDTKGVKNDGLSVTHGVFYLLTDADISTHLQQELYYSNMTVLASNVERSTAVL